MGCNASGLRQERIEIGMNVYHCLYHCLLIPPNHHKKSPIHGVAGLFQWYLEGICWPDGSFQWSYFVGLLFFCPRLWRRRSNGSSKADRGWKRGHSMCHFHHFLALKTKHSMFSSLHVFAWWRVTNILCFLADWENILGVYCEMNFVILSCTFSPKVTVSLLRP